MGQPLREFGRMSSDVPPLAAASLALVGWPQSCGNGMHRASLVVSTPLTDSFTPPRNFPHVITSSFLKQRTAAGGTEGFAKCLAQKDFESETPSGLGVFCLCAIFDQRRGRLCTWRRPHSRQSERGSQEEGY